MRNVALKELGSANKAIELFLNKHIMKQSHDIERIIGKACDLADVEVVTASDDVSQGRELKECIQHPEHGHVLFSIDKHSIHSLLCKHLKVDADEADNIAITNTHKRFYNRLISQLSKALTLCDDIRLADPETFVASQIDVTLDIIHEGEKIASVGIALDTDYIDTLSKDHRPSTQVDSDIMARALQHVPVKVECEIMKATHSLDKVVSLKAGDFLAMKKLPQANVKVNGITMFKGLVTKQDRELGVKINEQLR